MKVNSLHRKKMKHSGFNNLIDNLFIDGIELNDLISKNGLGFKAKYLIPTISCGITSNWDREYIWSLLNNKKSNEVYLPILMCVEGDLSCLEHMVFVHIEYKSDFVYWKKFGVLSNAKKYTTVLEEDLNQRLEFCSKTVDSIKLEEIDWFKKGNIYKFDRVKYEYLIDYYRKTNEEQKNIKKITDWFLSIKVNKKREYIYIYANSKNEIKLNSSNKKINNWSEWLKKSECKSKRNNLKLSLGTEQLLLSKKIIELIKKSVAETKTYAGENLIKCSSIIFIGDDKSKMISIKNRKIKNGGIIGIHSSRYNLRNLETTSFRLRTSNLA